MLAMQSHVTLLRPDGRGPDSKRGTRGLPADLLDQVRARVRLLALLIFIAFSFDLVLFSIQWIGTTLSGGAVSATFSRYRDFQIFNLLGALASAGLWVAARGKRLPPERLHTIGLAYEIAICFLVAFISIWSYYLEHRLIPNITWVPAIVLLFPLILPGLPRRMLVAAIVAGAMSPLALGALVATGRVMASPEDFVRLSISSSFAIFFAYMGSRIIYRLGREVAEARELGSYRLEERLGEGGMGEVWRAKHRMLARPAAIKLIRRELIGASGAAGSGAAAERFEREAQVIASLRSPHTVNLFDFGVAADGTFYYVMELLDGHDADSLVRRFGPLPAERVIHILRQICHSLSEAHGRGLVHRDIKPANVFVCRYGEEHDFVKVLDFGLVKALDDREPGADGVTPTLTSETVVPGTPAFIAPEQALGRSGLDGRVDLYATGCVAYWLLTGSLVFSGETPLQILLRHVNDPPAPPSSRTELPIPPALERLVLACLAKDPGARPQSARELSDALAAIDGAEVWSEGRARAWWDAHLPAGSEGRRL
ncbi:MAG TPA: serine/threonine-protein kinase [Candidatus Eisenbacteria bacterium]|nr:serine/threonine-protein kinase [Candidatus Eisenbacteria bacterium]